MNRDLEVGYGYTLADLDRMARQSCAADRSLASDAHTRYDVAWSAIALAIAEAPHWPQRESLVEAGWKAIYAEVREMRHTFGFKDREGTNGVASGQRFMEYWWHGVTHFEDALVERLALPAVLSTLTDTYRTAITALAVHDDYAVAAQAMNLKRPAFQRRIDVARRTIRTHWYAPETAPRKTGTDRRLGVRGKALITHCAHGHEWTPENTRMRRSSRTGRITPGNRTCRTCERERKRT